MTIPPRDPNATRAQEAERLRAIVTMCRFCQGDGFTVESRSETGYGHACGGDERVCQRVCPVPEEIEVQTQVECEHCRGRIASR